MKPMISDSFMMFAMVMLFLVTILMYMTEVIS